MLVAAVAVGFAFVVRSTLFEVSLIPSESMDPTLQVGDRIGVEKLTGSSLEVHRGDIVTFKDPGGWLPSNIPAPDVVTGALVWLGVLPHDLGGQLIKRVIGIPGDKVVCCDADGRLTVNGDPVDEPYLPSSLERASGEDFSVTVPEGHMWVMGDNREASADSRAHMNSKDGGFVPLSSVEGRAVLRIFPLDRLGLLAED
ncbi:signal peptidase I [Agromyces sp. NPDC057679]|uniref:signal peptidase I n=1 Tax=Agromyces sp. NPDC057679 TaxID=3346207 RepID=UPI003672BA8E